MSIYHIYHITSHVLSLIPPTCDPYYDMVRPLSPGCEGGAQGAQGAQLGFDQGAAGHGPAVRAARRSQPLRGTEATNPKMIQHSTK